MDRAICYLPMPKKTSKLKVTEFAALADPETAARVVQATDARRLERVRADAERYPSRVLANALVNTAWRNGPVETVHAGSFHKWDPDGHRAAARPPRHKARARQLR